MVKPGFKILPPKGYVPLLGSEHRPSLEVKLLGPADKNEIIIVTIVLRRRIDGPSVPGFDYFSKKYPTGHQRLSMDEFAKKYGAHPHDIKKIEAFATKTGVNWEKITRPALLC